MQLDASVNIELTRAVDDLQPFLGLLLKEFQLLEYFMKHPHQFVTRDQIWNHLYEASAERISNVVAAQVRLLRRKLSEHGCDGLIETVPGMGYRFNPTYAD